MIRRLAITLALCCCVPPVAQAEPPASQPVRQAEILHHRLEVKLQPDRHELLAIDQMTVRSLVDELQTAVFTLHGNVKVGLVVEQRKAGAHRIPFHAEPGGGPSGATGQAVTVRFSRPLQADETVTLLWHYRGEINEPPREPRHLRFVTPSETAGHIGAEGVYLSGETFWYPDLPGSLPTFALRVKTPGEWTAVTHGRQLARTVQDAEAVADWEVADKTEALTLVANKFVTKRRDWKGVDIAAYLFPDEAQLADDYLDASIRYLDTYSKILGPYPFPKFAVVENFFASGLGMPSFTLLGSGIVKRRYVQPYALGHEIVHSWIGNSVFNEVGQGNWVEGLTTYLANYYYEELTGTPEQAREQRRMMLLGYAVYVRPEEDYPVARFTQKTDQKDNAIGYQKSAMVFHMLRREVGDEAFWRGLRALVTGYHGRYAGWKDLEQVLAEAAGRDLRWFFAQWVERAGAPRLLLAAIPGRPEGGRSVQLTQGSETYRLRVPLSLTMEGGEARTELIELSGAVSRPALPPATRMARMDPDYELFRGIPRNALPPMLNLFVTDRTRALVAATEGTEADQAPYVELAKQIASRDAGIVQASDPRTAPADGSLLILGGPGVNRAAEWALRGCGGKVRIATDGFTIDGRAYNGPGTAMLVSCRHPDRPGHVVTLFHGTTPAAAAKVARLLFFYGWQSYLVFQDGAVVARGDFLPETSGVEVRFDSP